MQDCLKVRNHTCEVCGRLATTGKFVTVDREIVHIWWCPEHKQAALTLLETGRVFMQERPG